VVVVPVGAGFEGLLVRNDLNRSWRVRGRLGVGRYEGRGRIGGLLAIYKKIFEIESVPQGLRHRRGKVPAGAGLEGLLVRNDLNRSWRVIGRLGV